jgi:hypothetical protein
MRKFFKNLAILLILFLLFSAPALGAAKNPQPGDPNAVPAKPTANQTSYLPLITLRRTPDTINGVEMGGELANPDVGGPADLMSQAGATWVRQNGLLWSAVEPNPGDRLWDSNLDQALINASRYHLRPILVIRSTPTWAQMYDNIFCGPMKPEALGNFANFMHDMVVRYSNPPYNVMNYELWNEPDVDAAIFSGDSVFGCWGDGRKDQNGSFIDPYYGGGYYAEMLKWVYPAIKQANPKAQVLIGGLLLDCNPNNPPPGKDCQAGKFLEGILANGGGDYFDGVSYHAYDYFPPEHHVNNPNSCPISYFTNPDSCRGNYSNPNWFSSWNTTGMASIAKASFVRGLLDQYGYGGKYLINTEIALLCGGDGVDKYCDLTYIPNSYSFRNTKAYYAVQALTAAHALGIKANIWYSYYGWRDSGLFSTQTNELEAVYNAYKFTYSKINWARSWSEISPAPDVKGYEFLRLDKRVWVIWYVGGDPTDGTATTSVSLPNPPTSIWYWINVGSGTPDDGTYQASPIQPPASQTITVGRAPVFVEFNP